MTRLRRRYWTWYVLAQRGCVLTAVFQYVARYEECVTPGMIASVPSQGNEQMAAGILQVSSAQLEAILGETELYGEAGPGPLHPMMEGECDLH